MKAAPYINNPIAATVQCVNVWVNLPAKKSHLKFILLRVFNFNY